MSIAYSFLSVISSYFAVVFALPRVQMPQVFTQVHAELHQVDSILNILSSGVLASNLHKFFHYSPN